MCRRYKGQALRRNNDDMHDLGAMDAFDKDHLDVRGLARG